MISEKFIKAIAKKNKNRKISSDAILLLNNILKKKAEEIISRASRKANFAGRIVIKKEDVIS